MNVILPTVTIHVLRRGFAPGITVSEVRRLCCANIHISPLDAARQAKVNVLVSGGTSSRSGETFHAAVDLTLSVGIYIGSVVVCGTWSKASKRSRERVSRIIGRQVVAKAHCIVAVLETVTCNRYSLIVLEMSFQYCRGGSQVTFVNGYSSNHLPERRERH